jgi:hypothetical protein
VSMASSATAASDLYRSDHWTTSSARRSGDDGIVNPSDLPVFTLMTNSNLLAARSVVHPAWPA